MRILFIGDVVGKSGRTKVKQRLRTLKDEYHPDYIICNGENAAHGKGITRKIYNEFLDAGIDFITLGNHAFSKSEIRMELNKMNKIIRPGNIVNGTIGRWYAVVKIKDKQVCIVNLLGKSFMDVCEEEPFGLMEWVLENVKADLYLVDFHAETTGEKLAFAYHFGNRVQMIVGTHTHVQTADARIIGTCGYISDVGMCGPMESILGRDVDEVVSRFIGGQATRFTVAEGPACFCGVICDIDEKERKAVQMTRIYEFDQEDSSNSLG